MQVLLNAGSAFLHSWEKKKEVKAVLVFIVSLLHLLSWSCIFESSRGVMLLFDSRS